MRFMMLMIPKGYEKAAPGTMPDAKAVEAMMKYNQSLVYCYNSGFTMSNLFQDGVNVFRPNEWFRVCVVQSDIFFNGRHQI